MCARAICDLVPPAAFPFPDDKYEQNGDDIMNWRHYEPWTIGAACVVDGKYTLTCPFVIGQVCTGKQRVFHRFYIRIHLPNGDEVTGEDEHNVRVALFAIDAELQKQGLLLLAAGLNDEWRESGLSHNSGLGYVPGINRPVHMLEMPPLPETDADNDQFIDRLIGEAVAGIGNSPIIANGKAT